MWRVKKITRCINKKYIFLYFEHRTRECYVPFLKWAWPLWMWPVEWMTRCVNKTLGAVYTRAPTTPKKSRQYLSQIFNNRFLWKILEDFFEMWRCGVNDQMSEQNSRGSKSHPPMNALQCTLRRPPLKKGRQEIFVKFSGKTYLRNHT